MSISSSAEVTFVAIGCPWAGFDNGREGGHGVLFLRPIPCGWHGGVAAPLVVM